MYYSLAFECSIDESFDTAFDEMKPENKKKESIISIIKSKWSSVVRKVKNLR